MDNDTSELEQARVRLVAKLAPIRARQAELGKLHAQADSIKELNALRENLEVVDGDARELLNEIAAIDMAILILHAKRLVHPAFRAAMAAADSDATFAVKNFSAQLSVVCPEISADRILALSERILAQATEELVRAKLGLAGNWSERNAVVRKTAIIDVVGKEALDRCMNEIIGDNPMTADQAASVHELAISQDAWLALEGFVSRSLERTRG